MNGPTTDLPPRDRLKAASCAQWIGIDRPALLDDIGLLRPVLAPWTRLASEAAPGCQRVGIRLVVHLKAQKGTYRQGVEPQQVPELCPGAARRQLETVGAGRHFVDIEDTLDHGFAMSRLPRFQEAVTLIQRQVGSRLAFVRAACSAAVLLLGKIDFSLVRAGISMCGHWPSRETRMAWMLVHQERQLDLRPVLAWKALVGQIQRVGKGDAVGYGRAWRALRGSWLAVVPDGYSDGYTRTLGNRARALVKRIEVPVVGRVCMNSRMLDVTDPVASDPVQNAAGDEVVLPGGGPGWVVSVEMLAGLAGIISHCLLARLSSTVQRRFVDRAAAVGARLVAAGVAGDGGRR